MIHRSTVLHLRVPFSFFLLPVFLFALSISDDLVSVRAWLVFFVLHFLLYPASNGYNSYYDKDEQSIGGLEHPPPVSRQLYYVSLTLDGLAIMLGSLISTTFAVMLLVYGLVSKAYSHPAIRLKKYPWISWLIAGFFQGTFTFGMAYVGINDAGLSALQSPFIWTAALLTSVMLWGSYPLTQVYQHEEDGRRGDYTLSMQLGIRGTFYFAAAWLVSTGIGFVVYYSTFYHWQYAVAFLILMLPLLFYFGRWHRQVHLNEQAANFRSTMKMNMLSGICLNTFFALAFLWKAYGNWFSP